jgi:bombesin-like receptor 3
MLQDISIGVSIFTLLILSVDRYTAIVTPFKVHNKKRSIRACSMGIRLKIISIWLFAACFSIPDSINTTLEDIRSMEDNVTYYACSPYPNSLGNDYHIGLVLGKFMIYFLIPVIFIAFVYGLMARQLIFSADFLPATLLADQTNQQQLRKQMKTRKSLAKVFLIMVVLFIMCFLPKHVFLIWFYGDPNAMTNYNLYWHIFKLTSFCLAYSNSALNPLTLYFLSKAWRRYFNFYICRLLCICKCSSRNNTMDNNNEHDDHTTNNNKRPLRPRRNSQTQISTTPSFQNGFQMTDRRRSGNSSVYSTKLSSCGRSTNYL